MGIAIFIEPQGELKTNLLMWKAKVEENLPGQFYCSHPPHSTLIHVNVKHEAMAIEIIGKSLQYFSAFINKVIETGIFWEDSATGGGHTLFWKIHPNQLLFDLQTQVAEALSPLLANNTAPEFVKNDPVLKESFDRYGYPFIGVHWIPHMTIASLQAPRNHPLIEEFQNLAGNYEMAVTEVSCWQVKTDQHICLKNYKLQ
jgi:2'-5' RNA ligase